MAAHLALSLRCLWSEVDERWPGRSKVTDGWIGDVSHQAQGAKSEHNPDPFPTGVVRATDTTSADIDPMALVLAAIAHPSTYYVIFNGSIWSRPYGFRRRVYTGSNPHAHHVHISILHTSTAETCTQSWLSAGSTAAGAAIPGALAATSLHAPTPPADFEETLMATFDDKIIHSPISTDDGKDISVRDALMYLLRQSELQSQDLIEVRAELQLDTAGRLSHDLRWSHTWLRNTFTNFANHFALPGDRNLPEEQRASGGRFYRVVAALVDKGAQR